MSVIINFPGAGDKPDDKPTVEKVMEFLKEHKLKHIVLVGVMEADEGIIVTGNASVANSVYLLEVGKLIVIEEASQ